ncbi:MAG TPA: outer membrane protein assembly factor BamA [Candidatus Methylomirabilis sp.]|nr:outer membrane protein assembly factor BamA [Candidatus Methylomirabilis sp.]
MPFREWPLQAAWIVALVFSFGPGSAAATLNNSQPGPSKANALRFSAPSETSADTSVEKQEPQQSSESQPAAVIERIEFIGNRRIRSDTLKARIFSREGDPYNEDTLRRDFQALWNTQFFEDVKLRVEDSPDKPNAKIIIFEVKERPIIRRIRYDGTHSVSESDILDRFKERKVGLSVESPFDPTKIKKAEVVLKELLGEHGRQFAKVTPQYERIASSNAVILVFKVDEGPKVKVGKIIFTGNHAFSDRKLIRAMKHDRPYAIPMYFWNINVLTKTYDREKLNEDIEAGIRALYQNSGYFRVVVAPNGPILSNVDVHHNGVPLPGLRPHTGKAVNITIPIEEGPRYRMGTLKIVSSDPDKALSLKVDPLKALFPLKEGDVFDVDRLRKALKNYTDAYGEFGFIDFTAEPDFDIDDASKKINLTLHFDEQKQYYVRRINFIGNTTTRDKVIRRELLIDEGQLFNKRYWDISILRLNQLNYFDKIEADKAVELQKNSKDGTVDINLKLKEKGKQSIGLQGGVSGLAGGFIGLTYQTNNFLGLGETLTFSAQFGEIERIFQFGFTEPYLFDRPISTGFTIFSSRYNFNQAQQESLLFGQPVSVNPQFVQNYAQNSTGFTTFASYPLKRFSFARLGLSYGLTRTDISTFNQASSLLFEQIQFESISGPSALRGIVSSTVTPSISYNTIDNPINPTKGKSFYYSLAFQGGPIGGNVNTITNVVDFKYWHPSYKHRNAIGFHFSAGHTTGYGGKEVPPFSRFYMGGEQDIRGFDIRSISPVVFIPTVSSQTLFYQDPTSRLTRSFPLPVLVYTATLPGGDVQGYGNVQYNIPIVGSYASVAPFFDVGTDGILNKSALHLDPTGIANIESTFPGAPLTKSLGIYSGTNFRLRDSVGIEFGLNIPIIQAPFRIYYAFNPNRYHQQVVAPSIFVNQSTLNNWRNTLDKVSPNLWETQIQPQLNFLNNPGRLNYFEPKTTFKFTVGKTF